MPYATPTLNFGRLIAKLDQSQITLLTITGKLVRQQNAEDLLQEAKASLDVPVEALKIRRGNIVDEIIQETHENDYDMVVIGENAEFGLIDLLLQPIPHRIAVKSYTSVLVVKGNVSQLNRILICTSGNPPNRSVIEVGARLAQDAKANVRLLHVTNPVPAMYTGMRTMEESLSNLLKSGTPVANHLNWGVSVFKEYGVTADLILRQGIVVDEIIEEASDNYDLIVIGAKPEGESIRQLLIAQVMPEIVDRSPCSVLIVRQDIFSHLTDN
jgi:nucleotide-binding universal stress UspA family protein